MKAEFSKVQSKSKPEAWGKLHAYNGSVELLSYSLAVAALAGGLAFGGLGIGSAFNWAAQSQNVNALQTASPQKKLDVCSEMSGDPAHKFTAQQELVRSCLANFDVMTRSMRETAVQSRDKSMNQGIFLGIQSLISFGLAAALFKWRAGNVAGDASGAKPGRKRGWHSLPRQ